ncbi:hypothetical protein QL285_057585 [Trifolium repens]|nr:hypothetical protein QL285_057585 [Trifolium repens]
MVAVGPGAANFVTEISIIVLKNAPFNVKKWKNIPEDIFNKIVFKVLRDPETQKEPNYQDLWRMTHTNSNGEWINDDSKEVHTKVQEHCSELLEVGYMDEDKDKLTNTVFEVVVGVRSGYSRGLGAGIKPQKGKYVASLHEELKKECEKRQDIEKKLKDVETQRQQELKMMEEMTTKIEESQRQLGEKVDKQVEAKVATMLRQMLNIPGGESSSALDRVS